MVDQDISIVIKDLQALPKECEWVEFKTNNSNPQEIGEYISALSNSACYYNKQNGYLVYGIEDQSHRIVGTKFTPKKEKIGNQEIENWLATQLNPHIDFLIEEAFINDQRVVIFIIDGTQNTPVKFKGEAFIRIGSYKKKLKDHPERERKIWKKSQYDLDFEQKICLKNVTADDVLKLIDYPGFFDLSDQPLPANKSAILEKLEQEKITSRKDKKYNITNLGALLFAKDINDFPVLSRKSVRVVIYDGEDRTKTIKEQLGKRGYAIGFQGLISWISDKLPTNEEINKALRQEITMYPPLAIRELVANAIIHQDLAIRGASPMVEIFSNRIEIQNPGIPLIDTLRFIDHSPQSRNEMLASLMRRLKICEERGSGIDKVVQQCEAFQLPAPQFDVGDNFTRITLFSPRPLNQMDKPDKIRACYQHCVLKYVSGDFMSNESLRDRFGIAKKNYPMASRIISESISAGFVKERDPDNSSKKYTKYIPFWA
jgi:ATP-dependent DNA helicase RecG